ncbi:MAG: rane protein, partial [Rhizobacter sp.]|nr:rane protein [Rhizobacter sp.]
MKVKSQTDFWSGLMFIVAGVVFAVGATNYSLGSSARPGPGYFPLGLGVLLAILGCIVTFKALTIESEGGDLIGTVAWRPLLVVLAAITVFGLALPTLGMVITIPILIIMTSFAGDEFHLKGVLLSAAILTFFSWVI